MNDESGFQSPEDLELFGLKTSPVIIDWYCKPGTVYLTTEGAIISPADATKEQLETCEHRNRKKP